MAFPGADYQVEIHHPNAALALATAKSGDIRPVGPDSHAVPGDHWLAGGWGEITIAELGAVAPYVPLPDSRFANGVLSRRVGISFVNAPSGLTGLESGEVSASVDYPASGFRLTWATGAFTGVGYSGKLIINGVPATFIKSNRGRRYPELVLQVLPTRAVVSERPCVEERDDRRREDTERGPRSTRRRATACGSFAAGPD